VRPGWKLGEAVQLFFANGGREAWVVAVRPRASLRQGLPRLEAAGTLGLLCLPGEHHPGVLLAALEDATRRGAFLLVDPPGQERRRAVALASELAASGHPNGALFYPPVRLSGSRRSGPPSGAVAGMYARTDRARGVWTAPAGQEAALLGVAEPAVRLRPDEIAELAAAGVNVIRRLTAGPPVVWGARTFSPDSEWKYVSVRRLLVFLERSIARGTQWAVFEPNEETTWSRLRTQCESFLEGLFRAGAFEAATSDEAYFVRCGRETMTQDDIDQGRVVVLVGVAPLRPAEFVVFRIGHNLARG
jgi:phage tail sheath protein FI